MRKAITFLGTFNYAETTYFLNQKTCRTNLFPEALNSFFSPEEILVFLTKDAENKYLEILSNRLKGKASLRPISIPDGKNEAEIWGIFEKLTQNVDSGDRIIFDITHAFRSIPFLAIIAVSYLRAAKDMELEALVYGAYEARVDDRSPVFDLTPFITLLDWTNATDKFVKTDQGSEISNLLRDAHQVAYKIPESRDGRQPPRELKNIATDIEEISRAMLLARSEEVMNKAWKMSNRPDSCRKEADDWAKPFSLLIDRINQEFSPLSLQDPRKDINHRLAIELKIQRRQLEKGQVIQAILLSREWVVTYYTSLMGMNLLSDRDKAEDMLNIMARSTIPTEVNSEESELIGIWRDLIQLRNDVAHCGMRSNPMQSGKLVTKAEDVVLRLSKIKQLQPLP
jgi:CRISPR-associated DxTHG motif protein